VSIKSSRKTKQSLINLREVFMTTVKKRSNKHLLIGIGVVAVAATGVYGYYHYNQVYPSTDNANLVNVAPKVGGYIQNIYVKNNQQVHKGDLLITIDPQDYALALTKAKQDLILASQQANTAKQQITTAEAGVIRAKSDYEFAQQLATRYTNLYNQQSGSLQDMQKYINQSTVAKQALEQANVTLQQAKTQYLATTTQVDLAKTGVEDANNRNGYTELRSPINGYVSDFNLQNGELVQSGQKMFGLVDSSSWWVDVNFKETQLKRIKQGQQATVELDMYNHKYHGTVQSISHASGDTFSLLPAQNATGNWVKVTQRFTVRVALQDDQNFPLRVGASSNVTIDTNN
jgi:membrane fusion protein (multidrug efflux system)